MAPAPSRAERPGDPGTSRSSKNGEDPPPRSQPPSLGAAGEAWWRSLSRGCRLGELVSAARGLKEPTQPIESRHAPGSSAVPQPCRALLPIAFLLGPGHELSTPAGSLGLLPARCQTSKTRITWTDSLSRQKWLSFIKADAVYLTSQLSLCEFTHGPDSTASCQTEPPSSLLPKRCFCQ